MLQNKRSVFFKTISAAAVLVYQTIRVQTVKIRSRDLYL